MIKIIANCTRCRHLICLVVSVLGLSACAPIPVPQFPQSPPQANVPLQAGAQVQRQQPARVIPQAGALPAPAAPRSYPTTQQPRQVAVAKQVRPQARRQAPRVQNTQVNVPPPLRPVQQPVQQQRISAAQKSKQSSYIYRPSAAVRRQPAVIYRPEPAAQVRVPNRTPAVSGNSANSTNASVSSRRKTATVKPGITGSLTPGASLPAASSTRPAPRPSAAIRSESSASNPSVSNSVSASNSAIAESGAVEKEVLDLSGANQKPTASVQAGKKPAPPAPRSYNNSPAVSILIKQANNDLSAGKTGRAAATLERALRIAPDNPVLWLRLAEVNAQQGNKAQAASMARKALGLAPGDANLQARGQRLIN